LIVSGNIVAFAFPVSSRRRRDGIRRPELPVMAFDGLDVSPDIVAAAMARRSEIESGADERPGLSRPAQMDHGGQTPLIRERGLSAGQ
jgi:hypothetical protein